MQHPKHKQVNPHNRSLYSLPRRRFRSLHISLRMERPETPAREAGHSRRRTTTFAPRSPLTGVSSRLFESAKRFDLQTQHELLLKYLAITTFRSHGWRHFAIGNFKRVENERRSSGNISIHSENWQLKHSTHPLLVQKCKYNCSYHHAGSCSFTNHGLRRYPRLGRGGRGHQDQVTSP